jgi:hypothetical protein
LPPGVHVATWDEIATVFGTNPVRAGLLEGLRQALSSLRTAGCGRAYLEGSFVSAKEAPGDFDTCWEPPGVESRRLDAVLLDFSRGRAAQKAKYGGELFIAGALADGENTFLEFFQIDKHTGEPKGIVAIDLGGLP